MTIVYSAIDCDEVYGTRREAGSIEGGIQASVTLRVSAANKDLLVEDLLFYQREYPNIGATYPPRAYQAAITPVYAESPVTGQGYVYDAFDVAVNYTTDPNRTLVSESIEPTADFTRLDHRFFRWASNTPLTEGESPGLLRRELKLVRKLFQRPYVPTAVISKPGAVHAYPYTSPLLGVTFPTESMLFAPEPVTRTITTAGSAGFDYTLSFLVKPNGWNKYWRPSTQSWEAIYLPDGTEYKSYPPEDLSALLF